MDSSHAVAPGANAVPDVVTFHGPTPDSLTPSLLIRALREQITHLFGDHGAGKTSGNLKLMYLSTATSTAIIRCSREHYRMVWAALTFLTLLPKAEKADRSRSVVVQVVRVSGTVRKAEEEAVRRARRMVVRAKQMVEQKDGNSEGLLEDIFGAGRRKGQDEMYHGIESEGEDGG